MQLNNHPVVTRFFWTGYGEESHGHNKEYGVKKKNITAAGTLPQASWSLF